MEKKYKIKQYSTIKPNIDLSLLSVEQIKLRLAELEPEYKGETRRCKICAKEQPITEYYPEYTDKENKIIKRRSRTCRDCELRRAGVKEVGKQRFADKLLDKYFRRCSICKEIKPLTEFKKSKNSYGGYGNNCYPCQHRLHHEFLQKQHTEIGDFYVREWGYTHGIPRGTVIDLETFAKLKAEIIESRKPKYFLDNKEFYSVIDFAKYVYKNYNVPITATLHRVYLGWKEIDCKITEKEARSKAKSKGKIKVIDTITGEKFIFKNTQDERLLLMFSKATISSRIKKGGKTKRQCKYKNPCTIERILI